MRHETKPTCTKLRKKQSRPVGKKKSSTELLHQNIPNCFDQSIKSYKAVSKAVGLHRSTMRDKYNARKQMEKTQRQCEPSNKCR